MARPTPALPLTRFARSWEGVGSRRTHDRNVRSLAEQLKYGGEGPFRRDVVRILDVNGVPISPSQVQVRFDDAAAEYDVTVPCPWTIDVLGWRIGRPTTVRVRVPGFRIEP